MGFITWKLYFTLFLLKMRWKLLRIHKTKTALNLQEQVWRLMVKL